MSYTKSYSIGEAARLCGVTRKQIRNWEQKNYLPELTRTVCGLRAYRTFEKDDLEIIKKIKHYLDAGFTLPTAADKAKKDISKEGGSHHAYWK